MIDKQYGGTLLYWGHRVAVRYADGTGAEGFLAPDAGGVLCLDGAPLRPEQVAQLRIIGVCAGPPDKDGNYLFRSLIHGRGAYRFPPDEPGAAEILNRLRNARVLCEADAILEYEGQSGTILARDLRLRRVRHQDLRAGRLVDCITEDGAKREGTVLAVLDDGFVLEMGSPLQPAPELISYDAVREIRLLKRQTEAGSREMNAGLDAGERIGLLYYISENGAFIGECIQNGTVVNREAFYWNRGEHSFRTDEVYLVRYTADQQAAREAGKAPPARCVIPLTGKNGEMISFPKQYYSELRLLPEGAAPKPEPGQVLIPAGGRLIAARQSGLLESMARELLGKTVFASLRDGESVCGRLEDVSGGGISVATCFEKESRRVDFFDLAELLSFGHITSLTGEGGVVDGRFRFRMVDLRSDWDRDVSRLRVGAAVCFRPVKTAAGVFAAKDVMCMEEETDERYAGAAQVNGEYVYRFGQDPKVLCGEEGGRDLWFPWDNGAVYQVRMHRAWRRAPGDRREMEWVESYVRFVPEGVKTLRCLPLDPLPAGMEYAIAWRNPGDDTLTIYRNAYHNSRKIPMDLAFGKADTGRKAAYTVPMSSVGELGGESIPLEIMLSSRRDTVNIHRFLVRYTPLEGNGIEPDSMEVLRSFRYPALAGFRFRPDQNAVSLVLCTDDPPVQGGAFLLNRAFSRTDLASFGREAVDFSTLRADNVNAARELLDSSSGTGLEGLRLAAAAKLRFMIWDHTSGWDDRAKLRAVLSPALNTIGRIRSQGRSAEQQEWARFLYMLSLRVDPRSQNAYTWFVASLAYQLNPRLAFLSRLRTLQEVTLAIVRADVSDSFYDAMTAGIMMLFVPMPFERADSGDKFRELVDPDAGRKTMDELLRNMDTGFRARYQASLERLVQEPSSAGTLEDLLRQAVEQCNAFRDLFTANYEPGQYEEELDRRLADPRARLVVPNRSRVNDRFHTMLERMHDTSEYDIFPRRKASFERAQAAKKQVNLYQETCLYQYLYAPVMSQAVGRLIFAMKKYADYSRPVLTFNGCDVIGVRGELLHLRLSIAVPDAAPMRQNAENVSVRILFSDDYEILPNDERGDSPSTERSSVDVSVSGSIAFILKSIPAGRAEAGVDFLIRPKDPAADSWTLTASMVYGWAWDTSGNYRADDAVGRNSSRVDWTELTFSRPRELPPLSQRRAGLFHAKFDSHIERYIRDLSKEDPDSPQIPALRRILRNRYRDVEAVTDAFRDPAFPDTLADEAQMVILQGQWRVGKSTVLNRIGNRIREIDPQAVVLSMNMPFVNREGKAVSTFSRAFAQALLNVCAAADIRLLPEDEMDKVIEFSECRRLLSRWMSAHPGVRVVLLLDEFTHLYADMRAGKAARSDLKELVTFLISDEWKLLTVAVGGEFTSRMLGLLDGNTIQKMPKIVNLQYLDEARVRDFARFVIGEERFGAEGSGASDAALSRLYDLTRGNMFLLQEFCSDLIKTATEDADKQAEAGRDWDENLVFTNRWIDRTLRQVAAGMNELGKKHRFDFLWNPFNEDENSADVSDQKTVSLLENEHVFEDYRNIFRGIIQVADGDTHTFHRQTLKELLTEGEAAVMTPETFEERFLALLETRKVLERVGYSERCYRIAVDLCFILLYLSR